MSESIAENRVLPNGPQSGVKYPIKVQYCGECSLPIEYCEYYPTAAKCNEWLERNIPELFQAMNPKPSVGNATQSSTVTSDSQSIPTVSDNNDADNVSGTVGEKKGRQKRGGKALVKTKRKDNVERYIKLARCNRGKKKYVTVIAYGRDSFDRFGDDLCEMILSYLPLSDCFGLQCVCKQFNALLNTSIFRKHTKLVLTARFANYNKNSVIKELIKGIKNKIIDCRSLNYVLQKCLNINDITCDSRGDLMIYDNVINTISNTGIQLKHLKLINTYNNIPTFAHLQQLGERCLKNVETLSCNNKSDIITVLLPFATKLKTISYPGIDIVFRDYYRQNNHQLFSNIESVKYFTPNNDTIVTFVDYFAHRLKSLHVNINRRLNIELLKQLACFDKLEKFYCDFQFSDGLNCTEVLKKIGLKCTKLKVLGVENYDEPLYEIIGVAFKSLVKLIISDVLPENIALMKNCVALTHLNFTRAKFDEREFNDIHLHLPQLISVHITYTFSDTENAFKLLQHLAKLSKLRDLSIECAITSDRSFTADNVIPFIENCVTLRTMRIYHSLFSHSLWPTIEKNRISEFIANTDRKIDVFFQ